MSLAGSNRKPALTAAASKIRYSRTDAQKLKEAPWQERAWQVYELEGSIYFMTRYRSAVARKIDYYAATVDNPGDDPTIDATYNDDGELLSMGVASKALDVEGGPELLRRIVSELMVHWDVPGEGYLTRFDEEPLWRILSTQELVKSGNAYTWGDDQNRMGRIDSDQVYRVWKAHPRFHWEADSPTKHILEDAEELILLRRELKARSQSRLPAGAWVLPDTVDMSPFAEDSEGTEDDFARELTNYLTQSVKDPGSAASLAPWILTVSREDQPLVVNGFVRFDRSWDVNMEQREALLRSIATGLDVPPEILTGMADLNHWSAWLVSEQAVSQHVAPTVDDILDSLTTNWFRPLLMAGGMGKDQADRFVLWRDLSPATVPPDRTDTALNLFGAGVISDVAVRRVSDFDEDDAPEIVEGAVAAMDADELLKRINAFGTLRRAGAEWEDAVRAVGLPPIEQIPGLLPITVRAEGVVTNEEAVVSSIADILQEGDPPLGRAAVTAAVRRRIVATELADIDAELLQWCQARADEEIERLLATAVTAATDPLDESMLASLARQLDEKIAEAQAAARQWVESLTAKPIDPEPESAARSQGIQVILAGVLEAVRRRLFTPGATPDPIDTGTVGNITTPTRAIRQGLSLAGGGKAKFETGKAVELVGNGQHIHDELEDEGFFQDGYVWKYGHPANTFEPHLHLDGKQFMSWDDPQLAVNFGDSWLRRSHYAPGDHKGCCCAFIQVIVQPALLRGPEGSEGRHLGDFDDNERRIIEGRLDRLQTKYGVTPNYVGTGTDAAGRRLVIENYERRLTEPNAPFNRHVDIREDLAFVKGGGAPLDAPSLTKGGASPPLGMAMKLGDDQYALLMRAGLSTDELFHPGGTFSVLEYTVTHEYGHIWHYSLGSLRTATPVPFISPSVLEAQTFRRVIDAFENAIPKTTAYSETNTIERIAEAFTAHEQGQTLRAIDLITDQSASARMWGEPSISVGSDEVAYNNALDILRAMEDAYRDL